MRSLWVAAEKTPDRLALIATDGTRVTAGELSDSVDQLVSGLRARGPEPGAVLETLLPDGRDILEVLLAAMPTSSLRGRAISTESSYERKLRDPTWAERPGEI